MNRIIPIASCLLFVSFSCVSLNAQDTTVYLRKHLKTWVYGREESLVAHGILISHSDSSLDVYPGSFHSYAKDSFVRIPYTNIETIKTKKKGGVWKGILIGGAIGALPVFFGEGGGYVLIASFPLGIVTGAIIGATSKKKYKINYDYQSFTHFTKRITR